MYSALSKAPAAEYVNVSRWFNHIDALLRISYVLITFYFGFLAVGDFISCVLCLSCSYSGVSGEGCGVIIEGSTPVTIATPPADESKVFCHR